MERLWPTASSRQQGTDLDGHDVLYPSQFAAGDLFGQHRKGR